MKSSNFIILYNNIVITKHLVLHIDQSAILTDVDM